MKNILITLTLSTMFFACNSTKRAYDATGSRSSVAGEEFSIDFTEPIVAVDKSTKELAGLGAVITSVTNVGFNYIDTLLKGRVKLFSSEFSAHQVYDGQTERNIPSFTVTRSVDVKGTQHLFKLTFVVKEFGTKLGTYYFELTKAELARSRALAKNGDRLDYTVEIKPTFRVKEEDKVKRETLELKPIQLSSLPFGNTDLTKRKIRTEAFVAPNGGIFLELDVKVSETNPRRVKAEALVALWTKNQEEIKKMAQSFIPDDGGGDPEEEAEN